MFIGDTMKYMKHLTNKDRCVERITIEHVLVGSQVFSHIQCTPVHFTAKLHCMDISATKYILRYLLCMLFGIRL